MSRPPNPEFQEWWNKQRSANDSEDLFPSSSSFLTVEIRSPTVGEKERTRSARQLSWIYLLKFQQIAAFITSGFISIVRTANRRIVTSNSTPSRSDSRFYRVIKVFLTLSVILLVFELVAYFRGWHFSPPTVESASAEMVDLVEYVYANWLDIRANYLAPPLQSLTNMCIVLFLIQSVDRVVLVLGCVWIKFRRLKPLAEIDYSSDVENLNAEDYPMVLLQIPMCNEREVRRCMFSSSPCHKSITCSSKCDMLSEVASFLSLFEPVGLPLTKPSVELVSLACRNRIDENAVLIKFAVFTDVSNDELNLY